MHFITEQTRDGFYLFMQYPYHTITTFVNFLPQKCFQILLSILLMILGICCIVNNALLIKVQTKNLFTSQSIELIEIMVSISVLVNNTGDL